MARLISQSNLSAAKIIADAISKAASVQEPAKEIKPEVCKQLDIACEGSRKRQLPERPKFYKEFTAVGEIVNAIALRRAGTDKKAVYKFLYANCNEEEIVGNKKYKKVSRDKAFQLFDLYMSTFKA